MTTSIDPQLIEDNLAVLRQGRSLLEALDGRAYSQNAPTLALSGVGPHLRHVLDFYGRFLTALESRGSAGNGPVEVDYDARDRDPRLETDPTLAATTLERTAARLGAVPSHSGGEDPMRIRSDGSGWIASTVARELQSLVSHTVHHYALIAVAVRSQGGDPGPEFGVAPSTLRHWRASQERAVAGASPNGAVSTGTTGPTGTTTGSTGTTGTTGHAGTTGPGDTCAR